MPLFLQKSLFLLVLLALAVGPLVPLVRRPARPASPRALGAAIMAACAGLVVMFFAAGYSLEAWSPNNKQVHDLVLRRAPLVAQGAAGLLLVLLPGWLAVGMFARAHPGRRARLAALALALLWCVLYGLLPFHLSFSDWDDYFVLGKFNGGFAADWGSNKPDFSVYDLPYRVADLLPFVEPPFGRYAVNGWIFLLYTANVLFLFEHALGALAVQKLGRGGALAALVLGLVQLGPVLLAHTWSYELQSALFALVSYNVLEHARTRAKEPGDAATQALAWLAPAQVLLVFGANVDRVLLLPVFVHAWLVLRERCAPGLARALAGLTVPASLLVFFMTERHTLGQTAGVFVDLPMAVREFVVPALVVAALAAALAWRAGALRAFLASFLGRPSRATAAALYLATGAAVYVVGNQGSFPLLRPWVDAGPWRFAENQARYGGVFFPFASLLVAWMLVSLRRGPLPGAWRAAVLAALAALWLDLNAAYVTRFYAAPPVQGMAARYQINLRWIERLQEQLRDRPADLSFAYVPLPRDHGDHYLLRMVRPRAPYASACDEAVLADASRTLLLSSYTHYTVTDVGGGNLLRGPPPFQGPEPAVLLASTADLDPQRVRAWCARAHVPKPMPPPAPPEARRP